MEKVRVLFLAANPRNESRLRLSEEVREISEGIRTAEFRQYVELHQCHAVRPRDLSTCLLEYKPHIVHFSGHGSPEGEIALEDERGYSRPVAPEALKQLFSAAGGVRCVVLNACWSAAQVQAIAEVVDNVIAMSDEISDTAAVNFSRGFYQAFAYGKDVERAFELGKSEVAVHARSDREENIPRLYSRAPFSIQMLSAAPEEFVFISYARANKTFVNHLIQDLQRNQIRVWVDARNLQAGTPDWEEAIRSAIGRCKAVILIASPESRRSNFVVGELMVAEQYQRTIIPVWAEGEEWIDSIPLHHSRAQHIDCRGEKYRQGFEQLIRRLRGTDEDSATGGGGVIISSGTRDRYERPHEQQLLLRRVEDIWIHGVRERSLHRNILIQLGMESRTSLLGWAVNYHRIHLNEERVTTLPEGTTITDIFDRQGSALLITGVPGAGKTTMLLELARDKVSQAKRDAQEPLPVVLNLSSWALRGKPIEQWLEDEINAKYQIARRVIGDLVAQRQLTLLLDGLDEVRADKRDACVEAINQFRIDFPEVKIAVCCRIADYERLKVKLNLQAAIVLRPLSYAQVDRYLRELGPEMDGLRRAIAEDKEFRELAQTPLMLSVMLVAYEKEAFSRDQHLDTAALQKELLRRYVEKMLAQPSAGSEKPPYTKEQVMRWLGWLACKLNEHGQTIFLIENLQPSFLDAPWQRALFRVLTRMAVIVCGIIAIGLFAWATGVLDVRNIVVGSAIGVAISLLIFRARVTEHQTGGLGRLSTMLDRLLRILDIDLPLELVAAVPSALVGGSLGFVWGTVESLVGNASSAEFFSTAVSFWVITSLVSALSTFVLANLLDKDIQIKLYEKVKWEWRKIFQLRGGLVVFLIIISLAITFLTYPIVGLVALANTIIVFTMFVTIVSAVSGIKSSSLEGKILPNQGAINSRKNGRNVGPVIGGIMMVCGVLFGTLNASMADGLKIGVALLFGGGAAFGGGYGIYGWAQHMVLRSILYILGNIPANYAGFLNYAATHVLVQRVGGGYQFIHKLFLDYFCETWSTSSLTTKL